MTRPLGSRLHSSIAAARLGVYQCLPKNRRALAAWLGRDRSSTLR